MWLTVEEVMELGISRRSIFQKIASGKWLTFEFGKSRNGKAVRKIELDSLPEQLQFKWAEINRPAEIEITDEAETTAANEIKITQALLRYEKEVVREAFLAEAQRLLDIVRRYEAVSPKRIKNADTGKHEFVTEVQDLCREAVCRCPIVSAIEKHRTKPVSPLTLDGWARKAKIVGLAVFLRSVPSATTGKDKREAKISPAADEWIKANWRRYASSQVMYGDLEKKARREKWVIPSASWLYRRWQDIPKAVTVALRDGEKAYNSKIASFLPRDYSDLAALQVLCGDHSQRDVHVCMPDGSLGRAWFSIWWDLRCGLIWGWHLDLTPSAKTGGLAYANGCRTFGAQPPARPLDDYYSYLQTDQGKDYKGEIWTGKTLNFKTHNYGKAAQITGGLEALATQRRVGFFDETGIKHLMARGYNAKEKPVERVFADVSRWEENTFSDGMYCGRNAKNKPDAWVKAWHKHAELQKKYKSDAARIAELSPFWSLADYREALSGWIHEYNTTEHKRTVLGGRKVVPMEEYSNLYTTRYEIPADALAMLLMKTERRTVGKNGINIFRANWWYMHDALAGRDGEQVEIRYSDDDLSRIWVVLPATRFAAMKIVEAVLVTPSSILNQNLNKRTLGMIKAYSKKKQEVVRDFHIYTQSAIRGISDEDAVAAMLEQPEEQPIEMPVAVGENPRSVVPIFNRMSAQKIRAVQPRTVSTDHVSRVETDNSIFDDETPKFPRRVREEWETED